MKVLAILFLLAANAHSAASLVTGGAQPAGGAQVVASVTATSVTVSNLPTNSVVYTTTGGLLTANATTFAVVGTKVGIGTSAPGTKLHMSSGTLTLDGTSALLSIGDASAGGGSIITGTPDGTDSISLKLSGGGSCGNTRGACITLNGNDSTVGSMVLEAGDDSGADITFKTNAATAMTIKQSPAGFVGIGTTAPGSLLHVSSGTLTVDGTNVTTMRLSGTAGACLMLEDTDEAGWTECDVLNGVMSCSTDADGICD